MLVSVLYLTTWFCVQLNCRAGIQKVMSAAGFPADVSFLIRTMNSYSRFFSLMLLKHDYLKVVGIQSLKWGHVLGFICVWLNVLVLLSCTALFFQVFYPRDSTYCSDLVAGLVEDSTKVVSSLGTVGGRYFDFDLDL